MYIWSGDASNAFWYAFRFDFGYAHGLNIS